ncbi:protein-disulfide reductase DsbD [Vibrio sp. MA40-2]|uniref:protein-disulfide reductase DsbD n=1 Tax=Vibrio sp. MA40-2 TaxID=3391828 RepID=UPI0039A56EF8
MRIFLSLLLISILSLPNTALALFNTPSSSSFTSSDTLNNDSFNNNDSKFVTVQQAFPFYATQINDVVHLEWDVLEGYYLYQQRLSISVESAEIDQFTMRDGEPYKDEFFGAVNIYTQPLTIKVPLISVTENAKLIVQYQGCAKAGFCYPPETKIIDLTTITQTDLSPSIQQLDKNSNKEITASNEDPIQSNQVVVNEAQIQSKDTEFATTIADNWWTPFLFLALGIGLAFTPCVLPMYPILTSIVLGSGQLSQARTFFLSFIYVQGMALTYTLLGLIVASAGLQFQAALQHPYVLISLSILFVLLAMSMFGLYTLQLPNSIQTWLSSQSNKQQGGNIAGVFSMGAISGLVCSPCTTAPLSGALLYVAQSGDLLTGAIALYALALGMGIPLIVVAVFGNKLLPKAGAWMDRVKVLFGFILLAAPIFLIERIIPQSWAITLWAVLGLTAFGWLYHIKNKLEFGGWKQSIVGIIAVLGLVASAIPIYNQWFTDASKHTYQPQVSFIRITSVDDLETQLVAANKANKSVMLDFYADWCVACKEFEKYTFHTAEVEDKLKDLVLLQADVTKNSPEDIALFKRLKVMGLPTIDFWDANGNYRSNARLTGFIESEPFITHLEKHKISQ